MGVTFVDTSIGIKATVMESIKIKYHADIDKIQPIEVGNWIDLRSAGTVYLKAGAYTQISLGVSMKLPEGYHAIVAPRSSAFKKYGILMANSIGIIDSSYCGNNDVWQFPAFATRNTTIPKNERICQFCIVKNQPMLAFEEVEDMEEPDRGGFGSTGRE